VGGSWIVPRDTIEKKHFHKIARICKEANDIIKSKREQYEK